VATKFKVSYVVLGGDHPGAILNTDIRPQSGERIKLGEDEFEVIEVIHLIPSRGEFDYLHVTIRPIES
jgi:hypothetical protein